MQMLTCPHCRALVDYSCLCDEPAPDKDYVKHKSVAEAKAWLSSGRNLADATQNQNPKDHT
jgi:hypothetical protein